jgi:16S rRNA (uracil1498-N3)-methyltransferase
MITQRTLRRRPGEGRWKRWRRIIREAAEQSGRGKLPRLLTPVSFDEALADVQGLGVLPAVMATQPVHEALTNASWPVTLFVGPEGGFAPDQVAQARASGVIPVTLGPRILRTETAAIVLVTLTMAALGELDQPAQQTRSQ